MVKIRILEVPFNNRSKSLISKQGDLISHSASGLTETIPESIYPN